MKRLEKVFLILMTITAIQTISVVEAHASPANCLLYTSDAADE